MAKLTEHAIIPTRGSKVAAGYDLYSAYDYTIPPRGKVLAKTDIQVIYLCKLRVTKIYVCMLLA